MFVFERSRYPTGPFPFMSLPWELRDVVYRELLTPEKTRKPQGDFHTYSLQPQIFRVSNQVHTEAKRVFQSENTWISISVFRRVRDPCITSHVPCQIHCIQESLSIYRERPNKIALQLYVIPRTGESHHARKSYKYVVALSNLHIFLAHLKTIYDSEISLTMDFHEVRAAEEAHIVDLLYDYRGIQRVEESEDQYWYASDQDIYAGLRATMAAPWKNVDEILGRIIELWYRGDGAVARGCLQEAHTLYDRALRLYQEIE